MNAINTVILILLLIIVIMSSLTAYKTETFANLSDPSMYPQTPNNLTAYDYIAKVKKWNVRRLTKDQLKVLYTMRALQSFQYAADTKVFPFRDALVLPKEHFPIFNRNINDTSPMTVYPPGKKAITLQYTSQTDYPQGIMFDCQHMTFEQLRDFLAGAYELYDEEIIIIKRQLQEQITKATKLKTFYEKELQRITSLAEWWENAIAKYIAPGSPYDIVKNEVRELRNKYNRWLRHNQQVLQTNDQLISTINQGVNRIWEMTKC